MYTFVKSLKQEIIPVKPDLHYYQICNFKNKSDNLYYIRHFRIDPEDNILSMHEYGLTTSQRKKFYKRFKPFQFKLYQTYNFDTVPAPSLYDINTARSDMLN